MHSGYYRASLSFQEQPSFAELITTLTDPSDDRKITLVCGAGVSRSAGLPDWVTLIDRLCDSIHTPDLAPVLRSDPVDPMRKADYILRMATGSKTVGEVIRDALYREAVADSPGPLADSIARLTKAMQGRIRLITTNFDNQLEVALHRYYGDTEIPKSFGLRAADQWSEANATSQCPPVLHVHGMVSPGHEPVNPIILSESFFLKYGPEVRQILKKALEESHVIFIGLSMADPNLIGPLSDREIRSGDGAPKTFLVTVPDYFPEFVVADGSLRNVELLWEYARCRCEHLADHLRVSYLLLKAYSEVPQLLYEVALAAQDQDSYLSEDRRTSTRYGHRLARVLGDAYRAVGAESDDDFIGGSEQSALSEKLYRALVGPKGPASLLFGWASRFNSMEFSENYGLTHSFFEREHFALFLWLRARSRRPEQNEAPPFKLGLLGTSAYAHRETWSSRRLVPIVPGQTPATDVAFYGDAIFQDLAERRGFQLWRTVISVPIIWPIQPARGLQEYEYLSIGVLALHSDRSLIDNVDDIRVAHQSKGDTETLFAPSIISFLSQDQRTELRDSIQLTATNLLFPTPLFADASENHRSEVLT